MPQFIIVYNIIFVDKLLMFLRREKINLWEFMNVCIYKILLKYFD